MLGWVCLGAIVVVALVGSRMQAPKPAPAPQEKPMKAAPPVGAAVVCTRRVGRYGLVELLGKGGFGQVHKAVDLEDPSKFWALKEFSLKTLSPQRQRDVEQFFQREQTVLSWLSHPAIVRRRESFREGDSFFLVMDCIPGFSLSQVQTAYEGIVPERTVIALAVQICDILGYLHSQKPRPIIFRDLKPANLMLEGSRVKLIDFGISRLYDDTPVDAEEDWEPNSDPEAVTAFLGRNQDTRCLGTPGYAAPEQYPGSGVQTDIRADIYSLGVVMHQLLTGVKPPGGGQIPRPLSDYQGGVLRDLEEIVTRATAASRDQRFASTRAISQALLQIVEKKLHLQRSALDEALRVAFEKTRRVVGRQAELQAGTQILSVSLAESQEIR